MHLRLLCHILLILLLMSGPASSQTTPNGEKPQPGQESAAPGHTRVLAELTEKVRAERPMAPALLHQAVTSQGLNLEEALEAVLIGLKNPERQEFEAVVDQALKLGVTLEGAGRIRQKLQTRGDICK